MEALVWYCIAVLLTTISIFYLPAIVMIATQYIYKFFITKNKIFYWVFNFLFGYLLISLVGVGMYYYLSDFDGALSATATRTDIVYIFTACAALCAPILVLFTLDLWRQQYRSTLNKEVIINLIKEIEELRQVLLETYETMISLKASYERNLSILRSEQEKLNNQEKIVNIENQIREGYFLKTKDLLEINTFKIFEKKCNVLKFSTILKLGTDLLDQKPIIIEGITIKSAQIIHDIRSKAINQNSAIDQQDLNNFYDCMNEIKHIVENEIYPILQKELYLKENPL